MPSQLAGDNHGLTTFQVGVDALEQAAQVWLDVEIVGARPDEQYWSDGNLHEVVDVSFRILGRPGIFTVYPEYLPDWVTRAENRIQVRRDEINAIYEGLGSVSELQPVEPTPIPPIGTEVAF